MHCQCYCFSFADFCSSAPGSGTRWLGCGLQVVSVHHREQRMSGSHHHCNWIHLTAGGSASKRVPSFPRQSVKHRQLCRFVAGCLGIIVDRYTRLRSCWKRLLQSDAFSDGTNKTPLPLYKLYKLRSIFCSPLFSFYFRGNKNVRYVSIRKKYEAAFHELLRFPSKTTLEGTPRELFARADFSVVKRGIRGEGGVHWRTPSTSLSKEISHKATHARKD